LRVLRSFRVFSKFRLLALAIQHSLVPLTWACVLIFALLYVTSLVFMSGVSSYLMSGVINSETTDVLESYFGGLDCTMLTLFMSISGGVSWEVPVSALMQVHVAYGFLFILFIASMMLAALNIIAGIFVNDAIEMAQQDREFILMAEAKRHQAMEKELKELFIASDTDHSGTLTVEEFIQAFDVPEMQARFRNLGVEINDAKSLFEMLDIAVTDLLDIEEFVSMCKQAKTLTRPLDIQSFIQQTRRAEQGVKRGMTNINDQLDKLAGKMDSILDKSQSLKSNKSQSGAQPARLKVPGRPRTVLHHHSMGSLGTALLEKTSSLNFFKSSR